MTHEYGSLHYTVQNSGCGKQKLTFVSTYSDFISLYRMKILPDSSTSVQSDPTLLKCDLLSGPFWTNTTLAAGKAHRICTIKSCMPVDHTWHRPQRNPNDTRSSTAHWPLFVGPTETMKTNASAKINKNSSYQQEMHSMPVIIRCKERIIQSLIPLTAQCYIYKAS